MPGVETSKQPYGEYIKLGLILYIYIYKILNLIYYFKIYLAQVKLLNTILKEFLVLLKLRLMSFVHICM